MSVFKAPELASHQPSAALTICVFCGARSGTERDVATAREVGALVGRAGHRLVYGGGGSGLMGEVAWAAYDNGATVTGVIPKSLFELERGTAAAPPQTLHLTESMGERKEKMLALADAFLALPGGYGTLDEVLEVLSLTSLGMQRKPLVLLDVGRTWTSFLRLTADLARRGFVDPGADRPFRTVDSPAAAIRTIEALASAGQGRQLAQERTA
jgi:uncharacterized protein (TIGR00730 family)